MKMIIQLIIIAPGLQTCSQLPHEMHFSVIIKWGVFLAPIIAPEGHFLIHNEQPLQFSVSILNVRSDVQTPARQIRSKICSSYSSLNNFRVLNTGFGADCPNPHRDVSFITLPSFSICEIPLNRLRA